MAWGGAWLGVSWPSGITQGLLWPEIIHRTHLLSAFTLHTVGVYMQRHHVWAQFQNTAVGALWWALCTASWITRHMLEGLYKYLLYCSENIKNNVKEQHKQEINGNDAFSFLIFRGFKREKEPNLYIGLPFKPLKEKVWRFVLLQKIDFFPLINVRQNGGGVMKSKDPKWGFPLHTDTSARWDSDFSL